MSTGDLVVRFGLATPVLLALTAAPAASAQRGADDHERRHGIVRRIQRGEELNADDLKLLREERNLSAHDRQLVRQAREFLRRRRASIRVGAQRALRGTVAQGAVEVWDTVRRYSGKRRAFAALRDKPKWTRIPVDRTRDYSFKGDCVVENEHLWLHLPAGKSETAVLCAKFGGGDVGGVALREDGWMAQGPRGARSIRILGNAGHEAVVEYVTRSPKGKTVRVAYRMAGRRHWIEATSIDNADRLGIGMKGRLAIVPSKFGEDYVCDALKHKPGSTVRLPRDNMVIALNSDGNFMSVITSASTDPEADVSIGADRAADGRGQPVRPYIRSLNVGFRGSSVFISVLGPGGNWRYERIGKTYNPSGRYVRAWRAPFPGRWRLIGRVGGQYHANDVIDGAHFAFACAWAGVLDCVFMYPYDRTRDTPADVATPVDVYRQTLGTGGYGNLLDPDSGDMQRATRNTRHRDVCGTVSDLKRTWKGHLDRIAKEPNYIPRLTEDAKAITARMEARLNKYRRFCDALRGVHEEMARGSAAKEHKAFVEKIGGLWRDLRGVQATRADHGYRAADEIKRISRQGPARLKSDRKKLDKLAEQVRRVADFQEGRLKEYRKITTRISELCKARRGDGQRELRDHVNFIGGLCGEILRNRDVEE